MKLSKKEFVSIIASLQSADELQNNIDILIKKAKDNIECDFMNAAGIMINHEIIVVSLLEKIMNDKNSWVSYFIYELNYGKDYKDGSITESDNSIIDLSTADKLYNFLKKEEKTSSLNIQNVFQENLSQ